MSNFVALQRSQLAAIATVFVAIGGVGKTEAAGSHRIYNVKTYGATGNGATDDTAAIQATIKAAGVNTGSEVYFPAGTYAYDSTLVVSGITVNGSGATLLSTNANAFLQVSGKGTVVSNLTFNASSGIAPYQFVYSSKNKGVSITGNSFGTYATNGILAVTDVGDIIQGNTFHLANIGYFSFNIQLNNCTDCTVASNNFNASGTQLVASIYNVQGSGNTIQGNQTNLQTTPGTGSYSYYESNGTSNQVLDNTISGGGWGFVVDSSTGTSVSRNQIQSAQITGVLCTNATNTTVKQNTITNSVSGVNVQSTSTGTSILKNVISNSSNWGVYASGGGQITISANQLSNCGLTPTTPPAVIYVNQPSASTISVLNNQYSGNTTGLQYFIDVVQTAGVQVSGNQTTTLLPTQIGP